MQAWGFEVDTESTMPSPIPSRYKKRVCGSLLFVFERVKESEGRARRVEEAGEGRSDGRYRILGLAHHQLGNCADMPELEA